MPQRASVVLSGLAIVLMLTGEKNARADMITLSLNGGGTVSPGATVPFDVVLDSDLTQPIIAFALNVAASDAALTSGGSDFSGFSFSLNAGLSGSLGGLVFDSDVSDDGRVEYGADLPPFGAETGILPSPSSTSLGTLSVVAPMAPGTYSVGFFADLSDPISSGGTYFLIDDGSRLGITAPGDGLLNLQSGTITVEAAMTPIPEPSSMILALLGTVGGIGFIRRRPGKSCRFISA